MFDFQEKKRVRKALYSKPVLIGLVLALAGLAHATWGVYGKYLDTSRNEALAEKDEATLKARAEALQANIARLSTRQGKEEEIRTKYGFTKDGEGVIVIVDATTSVHASTTEKSALKSFLEAMKSIF
jgi:cell division protein FtsB